MSARGELLFARYAYPPAELGYCGPADAGPLLRPAAGIAAQARQFEGAWCYLEYLSEATGIPDPLDARLVEAYWVGNDLLDAVDPEALLRRLRERFPADARGVPAAAPGGGGGDRGGGARFGGDWRRAGARALAHHTFQVYDVYPWAALLGSAATPTAVSVLDRCRIRTGRVLAVDGETATVECRPLVWDGAALLPGPPVRETARWSAGGAALLARPAPGDEVALHWDWICDTLDPARRARVDHLDARARGEAVGVG